MTCRRSRLASGISEQHKWAIVAAQHLCPVDLLQQRRPVADAGQGRAHGANEDEEEAGVDDEELVNGPPPPVMHILPFEQTAAGLEEQREAVDEHVAAQAASPGSSCHTLRPYEEGKAQGLISILARRDYNASIYSPSMGLTHQGQGDLPCSLPSLTCFTHTLDLSLARPQSRPPVACPLKVTLPCRPEHAKLRQGMRAGWAEELVGTAETGAFVGGGIVPYLPSARTDNRVAAVEGLGLAGEPFC